jgi:hypothetical protein
MRWLPVEIIEPPLYVNDILYIGIAINQGDFAAHFASVQ